MATGDKPDRTKDAKAGGTDDTAHPLNLVTLKELQLAQAKPAAAPTEPLMVQAQEVRGANGRLKGPGNPNIYNTPGAGVAGGFHLPDGTRPQDSIPATTPGALPAPGQPPAQSAWDRHVQERTPALQAEGAAGEAARQQTIAQQTGGAPVATSDGGSGTGPDGVQVHHIGLLGAPIAGVISGTYGQWGHPAVQRKLIPMQLKADGLAAEGSLSETQRVLGTPRELYLKTFSTPYQALSALERIKPIESAARQHLATMKDVVDENLAVVKMKPAQVTALRTEAARVGTTEAELASIARAQRQITYLDGLRPAGITKAGAALELNAQKEFFERNAKYLAGHVNETPLNWSAMSTAMRDSKLSGTPLFNAAEMRPVADLATKEVPYASVGGKLMARGELEAIAAGVEKNPGFFKTTGSLMGKIGISSAIVGTESYLQSNLAQTLAANDHTTLARIVEPNFPGALAKTSAWVLSPTWKTRGLTFAGAQAYEAESNMTRLERWGTAGALALGSFALSVATKGKSAEFSALMRKVAIGNLAVAGAAEITDDVFYRNDKTVANAANAMENVTKDPNNYSNMNDKVKALIDAGKENSFLMTQNYDAAHQPGMSVTSKDWPTTADTPAQAALKYAEIRLKFKSQLIVDQAQAETVLANGLTKSQWQKMQDPKSPVVDNQNHQEEWRLAPTERIDIGGQGARTLMGAIGSANLLEYALAEQPPNKSINPFAHQPSDDIALVEKQRQQMKGQLDDLFNKSHATQIENALKKSDYGYGHANDFNLVQMWQASGLLPGQANGTFDYAHVIDSIKLRASQSAGALPQFQADLTAAQAALDAAKTAQATPTVIAMKEKLVQARQDALELGTGYTAKLYRDMALMKLGQVQSALLKAHDGKTISPADEVAQLTEANQALAAAQQYAANNPDLIQLQSISATMNQQVLAIKQPDFQPNH